MKYAINISDLTKDLIMKDFMILPVCQNKITIECEGKRVLDGTAILLECDENRAKAIVDVIRIKWHKNLFRCYESKTGKGGWKRI